MKVKATTLVILGIFSLGILRGQPYSPCYRTGDEVSIEGVVEEVISGWRGMGHTELVVKSGDEKYRAILGPAWYSPVLEKGEKVSITGSVVDVPQRGKVVIARELIRKKNNERIQLRDRYGFPMWSGRSRGYRSSGDSSYYRFGGRGRGMHGMGMYR